jgi:SAM-dependent methyltransferase
MAADYDRSFTHSPIGRRMRAATWRRLDALFQPGDYVLELNCGTGEDAVHLAQRGVRVLATDRSAEMVAAARAKAALFGLTQTVDARVLASEDLARLAPERFDGAISNFGGLNCSGDLGQIAGDLATLLRPQARVALCVMGPVVPWEWAWYLAHGQPGKAVRRLRRRGAEWRGLNIHYPSIGHVRRAFAPWFRRTRVSAIGALLPPSYADGWARRHPRILAALDRWERRLEAVPPLPWLADHYLIELERTDAAHQR